MKEKRYPEIDKSDLIPYGYLKKIHGHQGNVVAEINSEALNQLSPAFLFMEIDGLFIPFQIEEMKGAKHHLILSLTHIDSEEEAKRFIGSSLYLHQEELSHLSEEQLETFSSKYSYLIGKEVHHHPTQQKIGSITDIDDTTDNVLLYIKDNEGNELLIPYVEAWVVGDQASEVLQYTCPEELIKPIS